MEIKSWIFIWIVHEVKNESVSWISQLWLNTHLWVQSLAVILYELDESLKILLDLFSKKAEFKNKNNDKKNKLFKKVFG